MVLVGEPGAGIQRAVMLNSVEYAIRGPVRTVTRDVVREAEYRLNAWSGGVGARNAQQSGWPRPNMVYDATADTSKPGGITPPLLIQTATQAGTPTQAARIFAIAEIGSVLNAFSYGDNAGTKDLIRWEWDGATVTWTRTHIVNVNTSAVGKNAGNVAGNLVVGYQVATSPFRPGYVYSTNGTSWTAYASAAIGAMVTEWISNFGTSATGYALMDDRGLYSFTIAADFTLVLAAVYPSTETVKAFFSWSNGTIKSDGTSTQVLYILTDKHLRQSNTTPNAFTIWDKFGGGNYALPLGAFLYVAYGNKGGMRQVQWDAQSPVSEEGGLDLADGLPSDRTGPVTYLTESEGYLYAVVSGDDASSKTAVYKRRWPFTTADGWHSVYKAATANQSAAVIAISSADDSVTRLHVAQENASTTDFLYYLAMSGTLSYENGGFVTWPEHIFSTVRGASAVTEASVYGDGLSADETITLAFDKDGAGSFTDFGAFTSSVKTLPATPDAGVAMNRGIPRITFARGATATNKATHRDIVFKVLVKTGQLLDRSFVVDLSLSRWTAQKETVDDVLDQLIALHSTAGQVPFQTDRTVDATARQVYVASVDALKDSEARRIGLSGKRVDLSRFATVTVREGIST